MEEMNPSRKTGTRLSAAARAIPARHPNSSPPTLTRQSRGSFGSGRWSSNARSITRTLRAQPSSVPPVPRPVTWAAAQPVKAATRAEEAVVLPTLRTPEDGNFQLYTIRLRLERLVVDRDALIEALGRRGVSARLYYPPLHRQRVFARDGHPVGDNKVPNAVEFGQTALSLPIFPTLSAEEQDYVIEVLRDALRACRR